MYQLLEAGARGWVVLVEKAEGFQNARLARGVGAKDEGDRSKRNLLSLLLWEAERLEVPEFERLDIHGESEERDWSFSSRSGERRRVPGWRECLRKYR